jgi:hypothetical protein
MENVSEILWVILRSLSRDIDNFPISVTDVECTIGAYDTIEYSGLYSERELLYPVQNCIT